MSATLNLITHAWLPVRTADGARVIRPDQIGEVGVLAPDWPRADLNLACLELLIGLVALAAPPGDEDAWQAGQRPDPGALRTALAPFAPAFDLLGDGPRFMQDMERLEAANSATVNAPDMLFLDSAGGQAVRFNADLMVKRARYPALPLPLSAMALYTLQTQAPAGGAGNRTSMRGGGPMVCLVEPRRPGSATPLWDTVWANVPEGRAAPITALPWMAPTQTSEKDKPPRRPEDGHEVELWFGMPRRLRLVAGDSAVTGVVQKNYGANYDGWRHPATPYRRNKTTEPFLPRRPSPEPMGYQDWLGVVLPGDADDLQRRPKTLTEYEARVDNVIGQAAVIVGGWAMDNMKPQDFVLSRQPAIPADPDLRERLVALIQAGGAVAEALRAALKPVVGAARADAPALAAVRGEFLRATQPAIERHLKALTAGADPSTVARDWLGTLRAEALARFDARALAGLADHRLQAVEAVTRARRDLRALLFGYGKRGGALFELLGLPAPAASQRQGESA